MLCDRRFVIIAKNEKKEAERHRVKKKNTVTTYHYLIIKFTIIKSNK